MPSRSNVSAAARPIFAGHLKPLQSQTCFPSSKQGFFYKSRSGSSFPGEHEFISVTGFVTGSTGLEIKALGGLTWYPNAAQTFLFWI